MKPSDKEISECPYKKPCGLVPCVTRGKCPADKPNWVWSLPPYYTSCDTTASNTTYNVSCWS